ncbi:MAG: hypothetical protein NTX91_03745 [candidate division SR1 bacterium]|nr:hypothetical protein [candidate division SR1 bacterium]
MDMIHENLQYNTPYKAPTQKKNGVSVWLLVLIIIITFLFAFLLFKNLGNIGGWFSGTPTTGQSSSFSIGQSVSLSGTILQNGDYVAYTHTLTLADASVVGLKSSTVDLNSYAGLVLIQGIVQKQSNGLFIVEVTSASGSGAIATGAVANTMTQEGSYIAPAGVYLPYNFGNRYTLQNKGEGNEIKVIRTSNNQAISLSYFTCTTSDESKDCTKLVKTFSSSAQATFTNSNGDKFYKLEGVNSWFSTNTFIGYFINDVPDQEVKDLANAVIIMNPSYVKETLVSKMMSLCTDGTVSLQSVSSQNLGKDLNGLYVQLMGPVAGGTAVCKVLLDPSLSVGGQKLSFTPALTATTPTTNPTTNTSTTPSSLDFSVKQFPVNIAKALTYTSSKGYTIVLPSSNISYAGVGFNPDFTIAGLKCSSQTNVIKYADEANLSTNPTVKIFECTAKKDITLPSNAFLQTKLSDGRVFVIEIMDGAWKDFASNITIQ